MAVLVAWASPQSEQRRSEYSPGRHAGKFHADDIGLGVAPGRWPLESRAVVEVLRDSINFWQSIIH